MASSQAGSDIVAMRSTVGEAAKWTVKERERGGLSRELWEPRQSAHSSPPGVPENAREAA